MYPGSFRGRAKSHSHSTNNRDITHLFCYFNLSSYSYLTQCCFQRMSKISRDFSECIWQKCKSAKHVTKALVLKMLSQGPFIVEDNNRWFYLKGKSCRVYFSAAFACLIIFSWWLVFIMQIHASPNGQGVPVRLREGPPKNMILSISWKDILTERGKHCLHMRVISFLCSKSTTSERKNALKSQRSMFSLYFGGV